MIRYLGRKPFFDFYNALFGFIPKEIDIYLDISLIINQMRPQEDWKYKAGIYIVIFTKLPRMIAAFYFLVPVVKFFWPLDLAILYIFRQMKPTRSNEVRKTFLNTMTSSFCVVGYKV